MFCLSFLQNRKVLKPLLTIVLLLFTNSLHAQIYDDEMLFKIRGSADSVSVVSKLVWPPGNEETEEEYKLQDSVMYRYPAADSIQATVYHYETHSKDVVYSLTDEGDINYIDSRMPGATQSLRYNYIRKPSGSPQLHNYTQPTFYIVKDAGRRTDTMRYYMASQKVIATTIRKYDEQGRVAEEWKTGITERTTHSIYEYGLYNLCTKSVNYQNDTLISTDTYEYVFDNHGNFTKRKRYTNGRIINVLYRRIYYN
jgi:hypothetical protein